MIKKSPEDGVKILNNHDMCVYAFIRKKNWNQNLYCFPIEFPYSRFV